MRERVWRQSAATGLPVTPVTTIAPKSTSPPATDIVCTRPPIRSRASITHTEWPSSWS